MVGVILGFALLVAITNTLSDYWNSHCYRHQANFCMKNGRIDRWAEYDTLAHKNHWAATQGLCWTICFTGLLALAVWAPPV